MADLAERLAAVQGRLAGRLAARPFDAPLFLTLIDNPRIAAALDAGGTDAPVDFTSAERKQFLAAAAFLDGLEKWHQPTPKATRP